MWSWWRSLTLVTTIYNKILHTWTQVDRYPHHKRDHKQSDHIIEEKFWSSPSWRWARFVWDAAQSRDINSEWCNPPWLWRSVVKVKCREMAFLVSHICGHINHYVLWHELRIFLEGSCVGSARFQEVESIGRPLEIYRRQLVHVQVMREFSSLCGC